VAAACHTVCDPDPYLQMPDLASPVLQGAGWVLPTPVVHVLCRACAAPGMHQWCMRQFARLMFVRQGT
jgi:hypothetical protein